MYLFRNSRFAFVLTLTTVALGVLLIHNTMIYFQTEVRPAFLVEKGEIANSRIWRAAFYFHIVSSCIVLITGAILFFPSLLKYRRLHFFLGYIYINCVLWIAAPTGLIMSPFSKGGWPGALGFAITGLAWWYATWRGYRAIRQRRVNDHIMWIVRSWCLSLSAISFRVIHIGLFYVSVDPVTNYVLSIWLSLVTNVWFAEYFIARNFKPDTVETVLPDKTLAANF